MNTTSCWSTGICIPTYFRIGNEFSRTLACLQILFELLTSGKLLTEVIIGRFLLFLPLSRKNWKTWGLIAIWSPRLSILLLHNYLTRKLFLIYLEIYKIRRYRNGNDHMGEHRDDEGELDQEAGIVSISLGQVRDFVFKHRDVKFKKRRVDPIKIPLGHGSLLHMKPPTNEFWYHALPVRKNAPGVRINLTFRKVLPEKMVRK